MIPQLAIETCARRLGALDEPLTLGEQHPYISWFGPAQLPADRPGSEAAVQALCGLMEVNGRDGCRPRRIGLEVASVAAGIFAAQGALAGEIARLRGHPVPALTTSVLQAGLMLMSNYFVVATALGDALPGPPLSEPGPPFRSSDGHWFEIETLDSEPWKQFWARMGVEQSVAGRGWTVFQWRYERATCSFPPGLHEATAARPLDELAEVAAETGVSLVALRHYDEVLGQLNADAYPVIRAGAATGQPPDRSDGPRRSGHAGRPRSGTDLPLAGMRMVEATSRIQGPFAGMLLRMLGAEVVRVQPPEGDYGRAAMCLHRGKHAVRLDLSTPAGRADLVELVADADVFLHNWRPGKAEHWGLDFDDLVAHRPGLVYAHASGWGERPEARRLIGTDFLVQAFTGMGDALQPEGQPAFPSRVVLCDLFGALVGAEGILTALCQRERHGGAWEVRSSLLAGAMAQQAHVLEDIASGKEAGRRQGRPLWGPLDVPVATEDGSLVVSVDNDDAFARLCEICGIDSAAGSLAATEARLVDRLAHGRAATWERRLLADGMPAAVVSDDLAMLTTDPRLIGMFEPVGHGGMAPRSPWS